MAKVNGYRSEAAKRLQESIESPEDPPDDLAEDFYDDDGSQSDTAKQLGTIDINAQDAEGLAGIYRVATGTPAKKKVQEED